MRRWLATIYTFRRWFGIERAREQGDISHGTRPRVHRARCKSVWEVVQSFGRTVSAKSYNLIAVPGLDGRIQSAMGISFFFGIKREIAGFCRVSWKRRRVQSRTTYRGTYRGTFMLEQR